MRHLLKTYRIEWAHRRWFDAIWYITASIDGNSDMLCASRIFIFILSVSVRFSVSLFFLCSLFRTWKVVNACICLVRMRSIGFCCRKNNAKFQKHVHRFNDWKSWTSVKYQKFCVFLYFEWCIKFFAPLRLSAVIPFSWPIWPLFKAQRANKQKFRFIFPSQTSDEKVLSGAWRLEIWHEKSDVINGILQISSQTFFWCAFVGNWLYVYF